MNAKRRQKINFVVTIAGSIIPAVINISACIIKRVQSLGGGRGMNMWKLFELQSCHLPHTEINGKWVSARPENYKPKYCSLWRRFKYACEVLTGKTETFRWPENQ